MNKIIASFGFRAVMSASVMALTIASTSGVAHAQLTSSAITGSVTDANGAPLANGTVTIIFTPTGAARTATTSENGTFFASGLRVGGPYTITVTSPAGNLIEDNIRLNPSSNSLRLRLEAVEDEVVATATRQNGLDIGAGVGSAFSSDDIINNASTNRDLIGTLVRDPLSNSSGEGILSIAGSNPKFTGLAIDGALQGDDFGLSNSAYATSRAPISLDAIESASVVATSYDPAVSGFSGGLINVVTKSGTNELNGSMFYFKQNENFYGDRAFNDDVDVAAFDEEEYGFSLGGPIVKDKLFFFVNYDKFSTGSGRNFTSSDENNGINPALYSGINDIVQNVYGFDLGGRPSSIALPESTERYLGKLDWEINNQHRASFTYQRVEENGFSGTGANNFQSAYYSTPQEADIFTGQLFSDWSENFTTNFRVNYKDNQREQLCNAGSDIGAFEIRLSEADLVGTAFEGFIADTDPAVNTRDAVTLNGGCDRFRQGNTFADDRLQVFGQGTYLKGDHAISFGAEWQDYNLDNLFAQRSTGLFRYDDLDQLQNQIASRVQVQLPDSGNREDIRAKWGFSTLALFAGDSWQAKPNLRLDAGVRYERIIQDDEPTERTFFENTYGFSNQENLDGLDLILPRFGLDWQASENTNVTAGFGLFGGGNPAVWVSNAFTPPVFFAQAFNVAGADPTAGTPQALLDVITANDANGPGPIDIISPDFKSPSDWKASVRVDHTFDAQWGGFNFGSDWNISLQALYAATNNGFRWENLAQTQLAAALPTGVAPDGRPIYADLDDLDINNAIALTNFDQGSSLTLSASLAKSFDNGIDLFLSYAHQDIETVVPGGSSRGVSNFRGIFGSDRNDPSAGRSPFETEHAFKMNLSYADELVGDLTTSFNLFAQVTSGEPFSYTFNTGRSNSLFGRSGDGESPFDNDNLFVPTISGNQILDPRVVVGSGFDQGAFAAFVRDQDLRTGRILDTNSDESTWNRRFDFRFSQEIPFFNSQMEKFVGDNSLKFVVDIFNVANLLDSDWGKQRSGPGFDAFNIVTSDLVTAADVAANGVDGATALTGDDARGACADQSSCLYRFNSFNAPRNISFDNDIASLYQIRVGVRYTF
jgi:outer membrane receptor for ferrienterochelin and colicin